MRTALKSAVLSPSASSPTGSPSTSASIARATSAGAGPPSAGDGPSLTSASDVVFGETPKWRSESVICACEGRGRERAGGARVSPRTSPTDSSKGEHGAGD